MRILNLSWAQDTGGQQYRTARAWREHRPQDTYTAVTRTPTFYPIENRLDRGMIKRWLDAADVIHAHNDLRVWDKTRYSRPERSFLDMPKLVHFHGSMFRNHPDLHLLEAEKHDAIPVASTLDLVALAPERIRWLPQMYSLDELQSYRGAPNTGETLRIAHAPTNRAIKSTQALIEAVQELQKRGYPVELDLIEGVKNTECLRRKGTADVYVDQLLLGYGCNAIEAFGMGIPVIAGIQPQKTVERIRQAIPESTTALMRKTWGRYPFLKTTEETLADNLILMLDPVIRAQYAERGMQHFLRWHASERVVERLHGYYTEAQGQKVDTAEEAGTAA